MKIPLSCVPVHRAGCWRRGERGSAVVVVLLCLTMVFAYVVCNVRTLHYLGRDLRLIERHQIRRLAAAAPRGLDRAPRSQGASQQP